MNPVSFKSPPPSLSLTRREYQGKSNPGANHILIAYKIGNILPIYMIFGAREHGRGISRLFPSNFTRFPQMIVSFLADTIDPGANKSDSLFLCVTLIFLLVVLRFIYFYVFSGTGRNSTFLRKPMKVVYCKLYLIFLLQIKIAIFISAIHKDIGIKFCANYCETKKH